MVGWLVSWLVGFPPNETGSRNVGTRKFDQRFCFSSGLSCKGPAADRPSWITTLLLQRRGPDPWHSRSLAALNKVSKANEGRTFGHYGSPLHIGTGPCTCTSMKASVARLKPWKNLWFVDDNRGGDVGLKFY